MSNYREDTPGLPNLYNGKGYADPLAINLANVQKHLVGYMTIDELAKSMHITTHQAKNHLQAFLIEHKLTCIKEDGVSRWSNFHENT
jgi:hypothetical protein